LTVTSELFQPAALAAGVSAAVTTGPVLSSVYDAWVELVWPLQLFLLKSGEAATVNALAPLPAGAVVVKVQFDLAVLEVCGGNVAAPVTATHLVSPLVTTVRVKLAPCLAYTVPPTVAVPAPPLNTALVTLAAGELSAEAAGAFTEPKTVTTAARNATRRAVVRRRPAGR
jgi:hypothetical protein